MRTPEHPLQAYCTNQLTELCRLIASTISIRQIFLLGAQRGNRRQTSIFNRRYRSIESVNQYHLLVLFSGAEGKTVESIQEKIESVCRNIMPVICWAMPAPSFDTGLENGNRFATLVLHHGLCCYQAPGADPIDFAAALLPPDPNEKENRLWFNRAAEFLAGAELYYLRKQSTLAAFLLHQCAEQIYTGWLVTMTGFRAPIHNLDRLHKYVLLVSPGPAGIFPRNSPNEEALFNRLKSAYVNPRYSNSYFIHEHDLRELIQRLHQLLTLAEKTCIGESVALMVEKIRTGLPA